MSERTNEETRAWAVEAGDEESWTDYDDAIGVAVDACRALIAKCDEVARLTRILAVERGDESAAPEGRRLGDWTGWANDTPGSEAYVERDDPAWAWTFDDRRASGEAPTALEAMQAADKAREASDA